MSNRLQSTLEVAQMGAVWIASISIFGISAIGATQADALKGVVEALKTHAATERPASSEACEACE